MEKLTPEEFKETIREVNIFEDPPCLMIFGEPGIGKSYAAKEIAAELGRKYIPLSLGRLEAYDIKGMPDLSKQFMEWKPPHIWSDIIDAKGNVLLHFDEFTLADENVQGAVLDIVQMKKIDDITLPKKTMIVISGNMGGDDGTFAKVITSALTGGRAVIFQMKKPNIREWFAYQEPCGIIRGFLEVHPKHLYRGPNSAEPFAPWSCPRSWSLLDNVTSRLELDKPRPDRQQTKKILKYAKAILSEDTVNYFIDYLENSVIEVEKVLNKDEAAVRKFLESENFRQSGLIKEAARYEVKPKEKKRELFQGMVDLIIKNKLPAELLALFAEELVKRDPETLVKLRVKDITLDTWADKLTFEIA